MNAKPCFENQEKKPLFCIPSGVSVYPIPSEFNSKNPLMKNFLQPSNSLFPISTSFFLWLVGLLLVTGTEVFGITTTATGTGNWSTATWSAGLPGAGDDVVINGTITLDVTTPALGSLTINNTRTLNLAAGSITVTGTTTLVGNATMTDNNDAGTNLFIGLVTNSTGAISSANNSSWEFQGGITAGTTINLSGTGTKSFTTNNQNITGAGAITFQNVTVASGITITNSNTGTFTVSTTATIDGVFSITGASGLKLFVGLPTISGTGSLTSSSNAPFEFRGGIANSGTLSLTGTGAKTFSTTASQALTGSGDITLNAVTINAGITLTNNNTGITTINGAFALNGTLTDGNDSGSNVFGGLISIPTGGSLTTTANSNYEFQGGITVTGTGSVNLTGTGMCTFSATQSLNQLGPVVISNLSVPAGVTLTFSNTANFTNLGTTSIDGTINVLASGGTKRFDGLITISGTGSFTNNNNAIFEFRGGIANDGTLTLNSGTGAKSFTTNNQIVSGTGTFNLTPVTVSSPSTVTISGTVSIGTLTISSGGTIDFSGSGALSVSGTTNLSGTLTCNTSGSVTLTGAITQTGTLNLSSGNFTAGGATTLSGTASITDNNNSGNNLFTGLVTVGAGCSFSSANNSPFEFRGGITHNGTTFSLTGTGLQSFTTNAQNLAGASAITLNTVSITSAIALTNSNSVSVSGALTITGSLNLNVSTFTAGSTTTVSGSGAITDNSNTGSNLFIDAVTVDAGCSFSSGNTSPFEFRNGITHNGTTFSLTGAGTTSFTTNNQALSGSSTFTFNTVSVANIDLTNNGTVTITVACDGTTAGSSWIQTAGAILTFGGVSPNILMNTGSLNAAALNNTVTYNNGTQTIRVPTSIYYNLTTSTSGTKTAGGNLTIANNFTIGAGSTFQGSTADIYTNNLSVSGTFQKNGSGAITVEGLLSTSGTGIFSGMTGNPTFEFQGGITHNSTNGTASNIGTGAVSFTTNNQSISGSPTAGFTIGGTVFIASGIEITNQLAATLTISGNLDGEAGSSKWINSNGANVFAYSGIDQPFNSFGVLDASSNINSIDYNRGGNQTIRNTTYYRLSISGTGVKTIADFTVNENFTKSGTSTITSSGTQTFATSTAGIITMNSGSLALVAINKTGSSLTLGSNITTSGDLVVSAGTIIFGGTARVLTVNGDLSGSGFLDMSGAGHNLDLKGENNSIGGLTSSSSSTVTYSRTGTQNIFESPNYQNITLSGLGSVKNLTGTSTTVAGVLNLSVNLFLSLGNANLILGPAGTLSGTFSANRMIITDGIGAFIKQGTTAAQLSTFNAGGGIYPMGTTGYYSPFNLSSLTATVTGTGSISVRAVPAKQPNVPYYNNSLVKYWELLSTNLSAISANMNFTFQVGEVIGNQALYEARVWNGVTLSAPITPSAPGSNPFSTTGSTFISGSWTAMDPLIRNAFYSYQTGSWTNLNTWTTDPSGSTLIGSAIPGSGDQVYILNGRNVTIPASGVSVASLNIANGGILSVGTTNGHTFGPISGEGLLQLSTVTIPTGNYTQFVSTSGGTIEYVDLPAGTNVLSNTLGTYNNLLVSSTNSTNFTLAQDHNLTINGNFGISKSSTGVPTYTIGNSATNRSLTISGNTTIGSGTVLNVGVFAAAHAITLVGNLTNNGTISLTNGAANVAAGNGYATVSFTGATTNTSAFCSTGSSTKFYTLTVSKNTGYELHIYADAGAGPLFWGINETIRPLTGTLRLGNNVNVPVLTTNGGNYDLGSSSTNPVLWIDGATVTYAGPGGAIVPYGTLKVSAGSFTIATGQSGIVLRETGQLIIEGGTVNAQMFRTSTTATTHRGSFQMTGGTFNLNVTTGGGINYYSIFTLPYPDNVFKMSGGTINITRTVGGGITPHGGIQIASQLGNYEVTGGTFNITITPSASYNFDIASAAPFYNLNISRTAGVGGQVRLNSIAWSYDGGAGNTVTYPAQPLTVLNDFTINGANSPIFDALTSNVTVGGNFTINSGGTYQSTSQVLTFNGSGAQTFSQSGSLGTGLSSLTINKPSQTLTIGGSAGTIAIRANLNITAGTLADGGKTLNVAGDVVNNGIHSGAGKIALNGSANAQTISGTGTSVFGNLDFSNTNGAAGSTQITATSNLQINGNLGLTTDRVASIGSRQIILSATSSITGTFGNNRHIKTNGLLSDGGIKKTYNSTAAFVFPLGYGSNYSPATIQFSAAPTTYGSLDVRPVGNKQLYVTDPDCFDLYWKVKTSGFSGIPANSINYTFNYGNLTDNAAYIPGYYNQLAIAFSTINNVNQVVEASNDILFTGVSFLDGDYTAGIPAAFGIVTPFYSRTNGNWNTPSTWSNVGFGGAASASIPSSNSPVLIGDGTTYFHTVTVTTNGTIAGSLIVDAGSTLDCQTTSGNNFGAIPYATSGGSGTIKISSSAATAEFPAGDFGLFFELDGGTCEFYSTGVQDFTLPTSTNAPTSISIDTYKNLTINSGNGRIINFPNKNLRIYNQLNINGHATGVAAVSNSASRILTLDADVNVTSGILELGDAFSQTLNIAGNLNIQSNGTLRTANSGAIVHTMNLYGNLFNEGTVSLNNTSKSNFSFLGNTNALFNGSNGGATANFANLTVNKGSSTATELEISMAGSLSAPTNNWLNLVNGNLKISTAASLTLTDQAGSNFIIPGTAGLTLNNSGLTILVGQVNSPLADLVVNGKLKIEAGTLEIGIAANNQNNDLEYGSSGFPEVEISGNGVLNINGQFRRPVSSQQGSVVYTQSGNSQVLVRGRNSDPGTSLTYDKAKFEIANPGSVFNMSGNAILTIGRNGLASGIYYDIYLQPETFSVTGGEVRIGNTSTPAAQNFVLSASVPFWNLSVDGTTNTKTLTLIAAPLTVLNNLRIEGNSVLNTTGLNVTIGGSFENQNTTATTGLAVGGYRTAVATQITTFNSSSANQNVTGVAGNLTNFAILNIENSFGGGQVSLAANSNIRVAGQLNINNGLFNTGANLATVLTNVTNDGGHSSSGAGYLVFAGTVKQFINSASTATFGSIRINNAAGIDANADITMNGNIDFTSGILYINNRSLQLGLSSTITGTLNSSNMIRLNGVASDAGVTKSYPASAHDFTFPIGVTLKYTPARFNVTSNTVAGTITVKPINTKHPATTDPLDKELAYHWKTSSTGFNGSTTVNHTYNYLNLDVNGTETSYVTGRFFAAAWTPTFGIPATVDAINHRFTLTGVNYFDGDYTAGESSEFNILTTFYSRNATLGGDWNDPNSWSTDVVLKHAGAAAVTFPNFNPVEIASGHTITTTANGYTTVSALVNGNLVLNNTIGQNFGTVNGTGTITQTPTGANQYIFPGGDYSAFTAATGGTFEFAGATNGTLSTQSVYNNLLFSGSGVKSLPNANLTLNGNLTISAGQVANPSNRDISLAGNWTNSVGIGGFSAGTGLVNLTGTNQSITGSTDFYRLSTTAVGIKSLASSISVTNALTLTNGIFQTGGNLLTIPVGASVSGGSATSHVNGNLRKGIPGSAVSTTFEIGDGTFYAPVSLNYSGTTVGGGFITANTTSGDHPNIYFSGIDQSKSVNRFWSITNSGVTGFTGYGATFNFNAGDLDGGAVTSNFIISRENAGVWTQPTVGTLTGTSSQATGISGTVFGDFQIGQPNDGYLWTGIINTNWNNPGNWVPTTVPTSANNAIIGNVTNQPTFTSGSNGECKKLVLYAGANPTIPSGYTLTIYDNIEAAGNAIDGVGDISIFGTPTLLSGSLSINCNTLIPATKTLNLGVGSSISFGGDLNIAGSLVHNNLPINFTGANPSLISGNLSFYDLVVNKSNPAIAVSLGSNATVSNNLDMQSGDLDLNAKDLDLGATGNLINESETNSVTGRTGGMIKATRNLNAPSSVNVAGLGAELTSAVNLGSTEITRRHNQVVFGFGFGTHRVYGIHPTTNTGLNATLVYNYFDHELVTDAGTIVEADLDLWRYNGISWDRQLATLNMAANKMTKSNIPQFSDWTSASYINNPLALSLVYFEVSCKNNSPVAIWKTARESENKWFVVEGSTDGKEWTEVGRTAGQGNSQTEVSYQIPFQNLPLTYRQLRLIALDSEGNRSILPSRSISCGLGKNDLISKIYPNPTEGKFKVDFLGDASGITEIKILNVLGKLVAFHSIDLNRQSSLSVDLAGLPAGIYSVQISNADSGEKPSIHSVILR
jgi:fibronectin-binding autotransporter adhesin